MIELENGVFMEQVEDLSRKKLWPDVRDMLLLLEPADIAAILAEVSVDASQVSFDLKPNKVLLFDRETEERLHFNTK